MNKGLLILVLSITAISVHAQWSGGVKAGANLIYSKWSVQSSSDIYTNASLHGGGYLNCMVTKTLSLQTEVLYNGLKIEFAGQELATTYLSLPFAIMVDLLNNQLRIHAGAQLNTILSVEPTSLRENISKTEYSIILGAAWNIKKISITLRYGIGLTNLASETLRLDFPDASVRNNILQLSVGYQLFGKVRHSNNPEIR